MGTQAQTQTHNGNRGIAQKMTIILLEWTSDVLRSAFVVVLYGALGSATQ